MNLGIWAPYDHGETTQMACALGDLARALGLPVSYLAAGTCANNVCDYWDRRVRRQTSFAAWATDLTMIVWFDIQRELLDLSRRKRCLNVLVPLWQQLRVEDADLFKEFDCVATPCQAMAVTLRKLQVPNVRSISWYAGPRPYMPRPQPVAAGELRLYVVVSSHACRNVGDGIAAALAVLLARREHVQVTLAVPRQWCKGAEAQLQRLAEATGRLTIVRKESRGQRQQRYVDHDWTFCLATSALAGHDAVEALVHGCPVAAFDFPPYNEIVRPAHNGALLACTPDYNWCGAPQIAPTADQLLMLFDGVASSPTLLETVTRREWRELANRSQAFVLAWKDIWDS